MSSKVASQQAKQEQRVYATNRKAYHDYHILRTIEGGLALTGTEVKSVRAGRASLREGYARIENGELWLLGVHIPPYDQGNRFNHDPLRPRKVLVHKGELAELVGETRTPGITLVPLKLYDKRGHLKVELGLARGKREYDKREAIARREAAREIERAVRRTDRS